MASSWTLNMHPKASTFFIHVNQATSHKDIRLAKVEWVVHEQVCPPSAPKPAHVHKKLAKKWIRQDLNAFSLHLLEKLLYLLRLSILYIFCKLLIPCKNVQLHYAWCCCNPCQVLSALKLKFFLCLLICETWVPFIYLQPKIRIKSCHCQHPWHKCYRMNRESHTDLLHQRENFVIAYCIYLPSPTSYYCPAGTKDLKKISAKVWTMAG